jgi:hypothetical protein
MRSIALPVLAAALALAFATTADAAARKRHGYQAPHRTHAATRIIIRKQRSYLDPGTETLPLAEHYADYAAQPFTAPFDAVDPTNTRRSPLPDAFDLPGFNPYGY